MSDKSHMLPQPIWMTVLRGAQLVLCIIILGLAGYGVNYEPDGFNFDGINLTLYTSIQTLITCVYILVASLIVPVIYNYWAILGLDALGALFWLISFAVTAAEVAKFKHDIDAFNTCAFVLDGVCVYKRNIEKRSTTVNTYYHNTAAAAGLGALEFVLFAITLVFTSIWVFHHKQGNGHSTPNNNRMMAPTAQPKPENSNNV